MVVVRMDELVDKSSGLLAYGAVGVDGDVAWLWKIRNAWASSSRGGIG